jgi:hypothetical protein
MRILKAFRQIFKQSYLIKKAPGWGFESFCYSLGNIVFIRVSTFWKVSSEAGPHPSTNKFGAYWPWIIS